MNDKKQSDESLDKDTTSRSLKIKGEAIKRFFISTMKIFRLCCKKKKKEGEE